MLARIRWIPLVLLAVVLFWFVHSSNTPLDQHRPSKAQALKNEGEKTEGMSSALVIDLKGDGVSTVGTAARVHFDHDGDGFAELTGWVGPEDGLLVWDRNGNGRIDDGSELFGNHTYIGPDTRAKNGFAALAQLDTNGDGRIDEHDADFSKLKVWRDTNLNGIADEGELLLLSDLGITSLDVNGRTSTGDDEHGNKHLQTGTAIKKDGQAVGVDDVWFEVDHSRTVDLNYTSASNQIRSLPDLPGFGTVPSLRQAMARDRSGTLATLVTKYVSSQSVSEQVALFDEILLAWAGAAAISPESRGPNIDARHLHVIEAFIGRPFSQQGSPNPRPEAAKNLTKAYVDLRAGLHARLLTRTHIEHWMTGTRPMLNVDHDSWDFTGMVSAILKDIKVDKSKTLAYFREIVASMKGDGRRLVELRRAVADSDQPERFILLDVLKHP